MEVRNDILWRVYLSFIGVVLLSLIVLGRAFYIQKFQGQMWKNMSDSMHQKFVNLDAERGTIFSEDGQMLSTSIPYFDIYIDFGAEGLREKNGKRFKENLDSLSYSLADLFKEKSTATYKKELKLAYARSDRYFLIRKGLSFEQYKAFRNFPLVRLGRNKSGVIAEVKSKRLNPFGMLAKRTIGLSRDNAQNVGLERTYDTLLKGTTGKRLVRYLTGGAQIPVEGYDIEPENGKDVITTIDVRIQDIVESALSKMLVQSEAQYGTCIVMETSTGKIKAIANLGRDQKGNYSEGLNYALQTNEPGSTIKLATLLAVLDHGASINDPVEVGSVGTAYVGVRQVTDDEREPQPVITLKQCFAHSSNIGMSKVAYKAFANEPDLFKSYLQKFHLDKRSGIDLVGEEAPVLPRVKRNKEGLHAMVTASFGYALEVSPLQTLMLYNAIANDGKMMRPYLVSEVKSNGLTVKSFDPYIVDQQFSKPVVVKAAKECMEAVVKEGTAKDVFKDFPFPVAGKTGTAHVAGGAVKYYDGVYQASFVGYFPSNQPEFTCIVVIKTKPHAAQHFGAQLSAPVFKEIATKLYAQFVEGRRAAPAQFIPDSSVYRYAGYTPDMKAVLSTLNMNGYLDSSSKQSYSAMYPFNYTPVLHGETMTAQLVPDARSMTLKDAVYMFENLGMKVKVEGRGKVVAQDIPAGNIINKNQTISLLFHE